MLSLSIRFVWRFMTAAFISGLLRFARLSIDSRHKEVKCQASQEDESGEDRGRENCSRVTCKESFQRGAEKPDLNNQENDNERHRTANGHESTSLPGTFEISHITFEIDHMRLPLRLPQGFLRHPFRE